MSAMEQVHICEVGPRDGLQNERSAISTENKIAFVNRLSDAGHQTIEVSAFVSPDGEVFDRKPVAAVPAHAG